ncbi:hypothetical protein CsSME_00011614 [Camellia sinensis var. sinensis]
MDAFLPEKEKVTITKTITVPTSSYAPTKTGKKSSLSKKESFLPRSEQEGATPLAKRTRSTYKANIATSPSSSSSLKKSPEVVITKVTKAPSKTIPTPSKPKQFKMVTCKGNTPLVDSSNSASTPQVEDNPPEIISPPSVNKDKTQETSATQIELTLAFKAPEPASSIPKPTIDLDVYFEALSQKTTPHCFWGLW